MHSRNKLARWCNEVARCEYINRCPSFGSQVDELHSQISTFMRSARERFTPTDGATRLEFCLFSANCCARHMMAKALGADSVPEDLRPDEVMRARRLIAQARMAPALP